MAFIERSGFSSIHDLVTNLVDVLKDTGYKIIASSTASGEYLAIIEPTVVADAGGVRGLVGVVTDALSGNTIVKTDTSWISG